MYFAIAGITPIILTVLSMLTSRICTFIFIEEPLVKNDISVTTKILRDLICDSDDKMESIISSEASIGGAMTLLQVIGIRRDQIRKVNKSFVK